jgi:SAM-dependent methyltransferase
MKTTSARRLQLFAVTAGMFALLLSLVIGAETKSAPPAPPTTAPMEKEASKPSAPAKAPDVIYVPTPQAVVDKMFEMAEVKTGDVVYDLGCGDGRIVVTAAKKYGVKAVGFDIDPQRVKEARENVQAAGVGHLVRIELADVFTLDLREATVVTLYLLPALNVRLMPQLAQLRPGARIVSHDFDMRGAKPVAVVHLNAGSGDAAETSYDEDTDHTIYKWLVPWESEVAAK